MIDLHFLLTDKEIELSRKLTGVTARVVIPNGEPLDSLVGYTEAFPENHMRYEKAWNWVSRQRKDFVVVTNCPGIIMSVPSCCVRMINNKRTFNRIKSPTSTFGGNVGEIYLEVFDMIGSLIPKTASEYIHLLHHRIVSGEVIEEWEIDIIGETIISHPLRELYNSVQRRKLAV